MSTTAAATTDSDHRLRPMVAHLILHLFPLLLGHAPEFDRIPGHAQGEALLQSTVLTSIAIHPVHHAILLSRTLVVDDGRLGAAEEALASFARYHAVVDATRLVTAYFARNYFDLCC